ncbi:MAG: hypothetical protein ABIJ09_23615 [Pseudomonadota bacterium]
MKSCVMLHPGRGRHMLSATVLLALLPASSCYLGTDEISTSTVVCTDDQFCADETNGEYDHCGMEVTLVCCEKGSMKCGCKDDGTCNGELVCFDVPPDLNPEDKESDYCYPDWTGSMSGWQPH